MMILFFDITSLGNVTKKDMINDKFNALDGKVYNSLLQNQINRDVSYDSDCYIGNRNDPRIKYAIWNKKTIYNIRCVFNHISTIRFEDNEEIARIVMRDQTKWAVEKAGNELFIQPKLKIANDIMHITTNKRKYIFEISVNNNIDNSDPLAIIIMQFIYPSDDIFVQVIDEDEEEQEDDVPDIGQPERYNFNYMISKLSPEIHPLKIYDDGISTYFYFGHKQKIPAFFALNKFGEEISVNMRRSVKYPNVVIVNGVYVGMVLRAGKDSKVIVKNIGFNKEDILQCD